jgi:hypothetical protein
MGEVVHLTGPRLRVIEQAAQPSESEILGDLIRELKQAADKRITSSLKIRNCITRIKNKSARDAIRRIADRMASSAFEMRHDLVMLEFAKTGVDHFSNTDNGGAA